MGNANVELVQGLYAAFGSGEILDIVGSIAEDAEWEVVGRPSDFPTLGSRRGADEVLGFFAEIGQHLTFSEFAPKEFYSVDDKVFVLGHLAVTVIKTGKPVASDFIHVFTIKDGKVAAFREFTDTAKAAEAYRS